MNQSSTLKPHLHKSTNTTLPKPYSSNKMHKRNNKKPHQKSKPFQDLSNGYFIISNNDNKDANFDNKSINSNACSSSIEVPKGCLRFFLSNSSSSSSKTSCKSVSSNNSSYCNEKIKPSSLKTPNSAPNKENLSKIGFFNKPSSHKVEKVNKIQSRRKPSLRNVESFELLDSSGSSVNKRELGFGECGVGNLTPLNKVNEGLCLNLVDDDDDEMKVSLSSNGKGTSSENTKTPPVQASVSPEIQCGSSKMSLAVKTVTPTCYGAGHVVSGVTDKRKCRARGILTVGEAKALDCLDSDDSVEVDNGGVGVVEDCDLAVLPLPAEASMRWLLSPCNEEDEKEISENGLDCIESLEECPIFNSPASVSSGSIGFSPNLCKRSNDGSSRRRRKSGPLLSPCEFQGCLRSPLYDKLSVPCSDAEKRKCDTNADKSPMSLGSLDSRNVIQTPQSDMSSGRQVGMSWLFAEDNRQNQNFDSEFNDVADSLRMASLSSPKSHVSIWDQTSSSFQFDCFTTPSHSVDLSRFQKVLDDRASWFSNSTFENVSQSHMRISWRDGLVSRIFEMDEYDSCRCLSDEEDDSKDCENNGLKCHEGLELNVDNAGECDLIKPMELKEFVDRENNMDERATKELLPGPQLPYSCAESISTDGGNLIRSEDSDWAICYKNDLFQAEMEMMQLHSRHR